MAQVTQSFADYLARRRPQIEVHISKTMPMPDPSDGFEQAGDLISYLYGPYARFTTNAGKRIRPALCLLGAEAVGADPICALSVAASVEDFQSAALIHDDIADQSLLRRGEPCLHVSEGVGVAINVGDLCLVKVMENLLEDPSLDDDAKLLWMLEEIVAMERRTLEGQALDLGWARDGRWDVSPESYLFMASHKSAYYSAAIPLVLGAICGGGTPEQVDALRAFGMSAGLAFQLQDDLLNVVGDASAQGKDFRSDITEGKRTLLVLHALATLEGEQRDELQALLVSHTSDEASLARAVELMEVAGSVAYVRDCALRLADDAKAKLADVQIEDGPRAVLESMADFFVGRTF
jgi:geranylgeranyl diphosphate synthase type I